MATRHIRNLLGSPVLIKDQGVTIPITPDYLIEPDEYQRWALSVDIDTALDAGDIIVVHNGIVLSIFDSKCLIHEITDYLTTEHANPAPSQINYFTKILRFIGPIFTVTNGGSGRTDIAAQLSGSAEGKETTYQFFNNGANIKDKWFDHEGANITCDTTPGVIAANSKARQITFSNVRDNSNLFVDIYKNGTAPGNLFFTWDVLAKRIAWKTNGLDAITFATGDRVRIFGRDAGGITPSKAVVKITLVNTDNILGEGGFATL